MMLRIAKSNARPLALSTSLSAATFAAAGIPLLFATPVRAQSYTVTTLASFNDANGLFPQSGVTLGSNGALYGTTVYGGNLSLNGGSGYGTVYEIAPGTGAITTLAEFNGTNGSQPEGKLILDSSGDLFGTTYKGGASNLGALFEVQSGTSQLTTVLNFSNNSVGNSPDVALTMDTSGNLYGTTYEGGTEGDGAAFEVAGGSNVATALAAFQVGAQNGIYGSSPSSLTLDASGNLYGETLNGGSTYVNYSNPGDGTLFKIAPGGNGATTLVNFSGANGADPTGGLLRDNAGNLYGVTNEGGLDNDGTVFELAAGSSTITTLASFTGANGSSPGGGVVMDAAGNLYGLTGSNTVWKYNAVSGLSDIATVTGANANGGLAIDGSGNLYGTTLAGGANGYGSVFEVSPAASDAMPEPGTLLLILPIGMPAVASLLQRRRSVRRHPS